MKIVNCTQGSPEWWDARRGIPTASEFKRIYSPAKGATGGQTGYIAQLIADKVCQNPNFFTGRDSMRTGGPATPAMQDGIKFEPEARAYYALEHAGGLAVEKVGFCLSDCGRFGCSPDGLVGPDGGLELKFPEIHTHAEDLLEGGGLPDKYKCQVHGSLIVTGRAWWDYMAYCPGLPEIVVRVVPDEFTAKLKAELERFLVKLEAAKALLLGNRGAA